MESDKQDYCSTVSVIFNTIPIKAGDNIPDVLDFSMESDKQDDCSTVSVTILSRSVI